MGREEIITTVQEFLSEEFEVEKSLIVPDANLQETLELDSLDYVDLVVVIEENFGFKVTSEDFVGVASFNDFYDLVEKKLVEV